MLWSKFIKDLWKLLRCQRGCGDDDEEPAPAPVYTPSPETTELEKLQMEQYKKWAAIPYEDWYKRFNVPETALTQEAISRYQGLFGTQDYTPTSYEDYLKRFTPTAGTELAGIGTQGFKDLIAKGYGITDYKKTEQDYLDTLLRKYGESRTESWKPIKERLIGENLYESGPGFGQEREFGEETATGVSDITKQWAYEGIQREMQQKQYMDALQREDYTTAYNMALSEEQRQMQPVMAATAAAEIEKKYYDALQRGDIETAFNLGQILRQNQLAPIQQATATEFGAWQPLQGLYGQLTQQDMAAYQGAMQGWSTLANRQQQQSNLGGLGAGLGMLAGGLLALPTGGMSIPMGALIGGGVGGGLGSLFRY